VNAGPMLIKAYRIESRRHGSIDCQPVLMGIVHFTEGIAQGQLFEQERVAENLVMDHCPFSHDVRRGAETWDAESTNVDDALLGVPSFEELPDLAESLNLKLSDSKVEKLSTIQRFAFQ
jgi:hypothetical protein